MNITQIHALKSQIPCSTKHTIELLTTTQGNISQAVALYHHNNIHNIIQKTNCDKDMADKYYQLFSYNQQKAITKIKEQQHHQKQMSKIITTQDTQSYYCKAGFEIYIQSKQNKHGYDSIDDYIFILVPDCWLIATVLKNHCHQFDATSYNEFNHQAVLAIINELSALKDDDVKVMRLYQKVIDWLSQKSKPDTVIELYANI